MPYAVKMTSMAFGLVFAYLTIVIEVAVWAKGTLKAQTLWLRVYIGN